MFLPLFAHNFLLPIFEFILALVLHLCSLVFIPRFDLSQCQAIPISDLPCSDLLAVF